MSIYLNVPEAKGTANTEDHEGWIRINKCEFLGVSNVVSMRVGTVKDRYDTCPGFGQLVVYKSLDSSSNVLFQSASTGKVFPEIELNYVSTGKPAMTYYKLKLSNAVITHFKDIYDGDNFPQEMLRIAYTKIERTYINRDEQNRASSPHVAGYDLGMAKAL